MGDDAFAAFNEQHHGSVKVRAYRKDDLVYVRQLFVDGMRANSASEHYIATSLERDLSAIEESYMTGKGMFWVMERIKDDKIVGIVGLQEKNSSDYEEKVGELRRMSVDREERCKGRGRVLVNHLVQWARRQGLNRVVLCTGGTFVGTIRFYKAVGFSEVRRFLESTPDFGDFEVVELEMVL